MSTESSTIPTTRDWATKIGIKAYRYRALVQRRWWVLAVAVSIGLLCESWILVCQPVLYESKGKLVVGGGLSDTEGLKINDALDDFNNTQINILQGQGMKDLARQAVEMANPKLVKGSIEILATNVARSNIFEVVGHGANPEYTQAYVDSLMSQFIAYRNQQNTDLSKGYFSGLKQQLDEARDQLAKEHKDLQDFNDANPFWEKEVQSSEDNLTTLEKQQSDKTTLLKQLQTLSAEQILNQSLLGSGGSKGASGEPSNPGGAAVSSSDLSQQYFQTVQNLAQKKAELEERLKVWRPEHPGIKLLNDQINNIQLLIKTIEDESNQARKERIVELQSDLNSLGATIKDATQKATEATRKNGQYQYLQSAVNNTDKLYQELLKKVSTQGPPATELSITVLEQASAPERVPPGVLKHLLIGLILGVVVGCVVLYVIDRADDRISSSTEMVEHFAESLLGQIPNVSDSRVETGLPLLQHDDPRYTYAEAFRSLRSSLIFMPNQGELKSLIVTSSIPGEGKSTITSNLAITMAIAGARVLVVDADLRRGDLATLFDEDGRIGLSSVLRGDADWRSCVQKTRLPSLTLLPRGPVTNQSGELLLLPSFEPMMEDFKNNFDLILFNTSPILATDDTPTIAPHFDGTLMVIRAQFTSARLVHNSLNTLYQRQVNVLGLILNCVDTEMPDYYYYRYPKYYAV